MRDSKASVRCKLVKHLGQGPYERLVRFVLFARSVRTGQIPADEALSVVDKIVFAFKTLKPAAEVSLDVLLVLHAPAIAVKIRAISFEHFCRPMIDGARFIPPVPYEDSLPVRFQDAAALRAEFFHVKPMERLRRRDKIDRALRKLRVLAIAAREAHMGIPRQLCLRDGAHGGVRLHADDRAAPFCKLFGKDARAASDIRNDTAYAKPDLVI